MGPSARSSRRGNVTSDDTLFDQRRAHADDAVADDDRLHEVGRLARRPPTLAQQQDGAGEHAAERRHEEPAPPRQHRGRAVDRSAIVEQQDLQEVEGLAKGDRRAGPGEADQHRPGIDRMPEIARDGLRQPHAQAQQPDHNPAQEPARRRSRAGAHLQVGPGWRIHRIRPNAKSDRAQRRVNTTSPPVRAGTAPAGRGACPRRASG